MKLVPKPTPIWVRFVAEAPRGIKPLQYTLNMRLVLLRVLLCALLVTTLSAAIAPAEYQARRAELRKSLDGVMVLFGADDPDDLHAGFFQESNFLYLSGWREPGAIMMLTAQTEILFLPARDTRAELYTGPKLGADNPDAPKA